MARCQMAGSYRCVRIDGLSQWVAGIIFDWIYNISFEGKITTVLLGCKCVGCAVFFTDKRRRLKGNWVWNKTFALKMEQRAKGCRDPFGIVSSNDNGISMPLTEIRETRPRLIATKILFAIIIIWREHLFMFTWTHRHTISARAKFDFIFGWLVFDH